MFNIYLVIIGLAILSFAILTFISLLKTGLDKSVRVSWIGMTVMTVFFSVGYLSYIYLILSSNSEVVISLTAWIFFLGAIYVLLTALTITTTLKQLKLKEQERIEILESQSKELEEEVLKRTQDLNDKFSELQNINKLMVGREIKMAELKTENQKLKNQPGSENQNK